MKNNVLITGASSGIGLALAESFLQRDHNVVGLARDFSLAKCRGLQTVQLDLSDTKNLPENLKQINCLNQDFDTLILNACLLYTSPSPRD